MLESLFDKVAGRKGQLFQQRVWSTFLKTSKILLIYVVLHASLWDYKMFLCSLFTNLSGNSSFLFLVLIFGDIFLGAHNKWNSTIFSLDTTLDATMTWLTFLWYLFSVFSNNFNILGFF